MNTTSYLPGKAEFRTSTSYKKTWTEKAFPSVQPHTTDTNHTALVFWTLQRNPKVCMKLYHHQTMRSSTPLCLKGTFLIHQISTPWNKLQQPSLSKSLCCSSSIKLGQNYTANEQPTTTTHAQKGTRRWCFSFRNGPSSCWFPEIVPSRSYIMNQCDASPSSEEHTAWGAITVTPPEPLSAVYTKRTWFGLISSHPKKIIHTIGFLPCFSKSKLTTVDETQGLGRTLCRDYFNR